MSYTRFAIYYIPPVGDLATFGASWLGWDVLQGHIADQPPLPGLHDVTMTPRKYGFHGTLKPPFRLKDGTDFDSLSADVAALAARTAPGRCDGLELKALGRFLALVPEGDQNEIAHVAGACVTELDGFRAPASEEELARRRASGLSPAQDALLLTWGYPYVLDQFRFHLTLTGRLQKEDIDTWRETVETHLPDLPKPFEINEITLVGERPDKCFEVIQRYALTG